MRTRPETGPGANPPGPHLLGSLALHRVCLGCGCGASLPLGPDAGRINRCPSCGRDVHVPDDLWFRLHPPRSERDWYLELGGPLVTDPEGAKQAARGLIRSPQVADAPELDGPVEPGRSAERVKLALELLAALAAAVLFWLWYR